MRHAASTQNVGKLVETLDGILQRALRREPLTAPGLSMATDKALILARKRALLDPAVEKVESWYAWTAAMQASSALFAAAGLAEGAAECRIAGDVRRMTAGD